MNSIRGNSTKSLKSSVFGFCAVLLSSSLAFLFLPYLFGVDTAGAASAPCPDGLAITAASNAYFDVTATNEKGGFNYGYLTVTACTDNSSGFTLTMQSKNDARLRNANLGYQSYISTLSSDMIVTEALNPFPVNRWGWNYAYSLTDNHIDGIDGATGYGTYKPVPASTDTPVVVGRSIGSGSDTSVLYFGVRANTEINFGTYTDTITFTAVNNAPAVTDFATAYAFYGNSTYGDTGLYAMQDMNIKICTAVATGQSTTVVDNRNEKQYTITKARDGNCWMTQNLALGGSSPITLTPNDTNITENFELPAAHTSIGSGSWSMDNNWNTAQIYDIQDAALGIAYNWYTATASTGATSGGSMIAANSIASGSVCPKGWRLPTQAEYTTITSNYIEDINPTGKLVITTTAVGDAAANATFVSSTAISNNTQLKTGYPIRCISDSNTLPTAPTQRNGEESSHENFPAAAKTYVARSTAKSPAKSSSDSEDGATDPLGETEESELSEESRARVAYVESLIEALPSPSEVTADHFAQIEAVIAAYEDLTDLEKSAIDGYLILKYNAVLEAYNKVKNAQPISGILIAIIIILVLLIILIIILIIAKKRREDHYYGEE